MTDAVPAPRTADASGLREVPGPSGFDHRVERSLVDASSATWLPMLVVECDGPVPQLEHARVLWANTAAHELMQVSGGYLSGLRVSALLAPVETGVFRPEVMRPARGGRARVRLLAGQGPGSEVVLGALPSPSSRTWTLTLAPVGTDAERTALLHASAQERRFAALVEHSPVPTMISEAGLRLAHVNDAFCALLGEAQTDLLGTGWTSRVAAEHLPGVLESVEQVLAGQPAAAEVRLHRTDGEHRWVHLRLAPASTPGHGAGFVGTLEDFTERRAFEERLAFQARHDALTGLPNRVRLVEAMHERLQAAVPGASAMTCLFLDLDNFKVINDSLGHDAGDQLLVAVADRLRAAVRAGDLVARWGGDEFVVLCDGMPDEAAAQAVGEKVLSRLREGVTIDGVHFNVAASVGVARAAAHHTTPDEVLQDCDIAMYRAKRAGRDRVALCDGDARVQAHEALLLTLELRTALAERQLTVEYQPVLDLDDAGALPAVEALVRWHHPVRGTVPPDVLVATAEANGLIDVLGLFVLREACEQMLRWQVELGPAAPAKVNVNLSAIQLCSPHVVDDVAKVLAETGLPARRLCLEVTETALMQDRELSRERLLRLRDMGVQIALDDFGTGYSSLAYLRQLPVDYLKVDRSFVTELGQGHPEVASAVIGLARSLGLVSVAEGVEDAGQEAALRDLGARLVQGWYYARAMTGDALVAWRRERA